jgi:hypothetical protein
MGKKNQTTKNVDNLLCPLYAPLPSLGPTLNPPFFRSPPEGLLYGFGLELGGIFCPFPLVSPISPFFYPFLSDV